MEALTVTQPRQKLKRLRVLKGTQRMIAAQFDITEAHWREIENGKSVPGTKLLFKICHYFDSTVYELFPDLAHPNFFNNDSN